VHNLLRQDRKEIDKVRNKITLTYYHVIKKTDNAIHKQCVLTILTRKGSLMNKTDLINCLSEETTYSKRDVARLLDSLTRIVERTLKKGDKVQWSGFGTFAISKHPAREGVNPATKERINIPPRLVAKFKAGKNLKESLKSMSIR
jgi:DNA-binding protein HU-beta